MARRQLTDLAVKAIRPRAEYFEVADGTSGLRLAVFPSGAKSWIRRYRRPDGGKTAKLTIGRYPPMPLAEARVRVAEARDAVSKGTDPGESKQRAKIAAEQAAAERAGDTVELHVKQHFERASREISESHWKQARLALEGDAVRAWRGRPVAAITRRDVRELSETIAATRGPIAGNRAFGHIRKFFGALVERDVIAASPCIGLKRPVKDEPTRERVLSAVEIAALWRALDSVGGPACAAVKVLLLTGQRRGEVSAMRFDELAGDVWSLPKERTKNGRPHSITLSRQALAVIAQQPRIAGCDFVFTAGSKPVGSNFSRTKIAVDCVMAPPAPWCWHDLRRTCASGMQRLGVRAEVIERALNHVSGVYRSVAGIYQRDPLTEDVRDALARWGDFVERTVKGESSGKIVKLR